MATLRSLAPEAMRNTLDLLGRRNALLILWALHEKAPQRFSDLLENLGVNRATLSGRLAELQEAGLVSRTAYRELPPRVEYALTTRGAGLVPALLAIEAWAHEHGAQGSSSVE